MDIDREIVKRVPCTRMILDHCGKLGIAEGAIEQYRDDAAELSRHPNLWIRLSDPPAEADVRVGVPTSDVAGPPLLPVAAPLSP